MVSRYVNGPVKQEPSICLLPQPPPQHSHHFRMMQQQRADFHVQQQSFGQQPPAQAGNQGPGLRGMPPTVPPNQASTPPNTDMKVQSMQQSSLNMSYAQGRGNQNFYNRPPPGNQTRMVNTRQAQQPGMYPTQPSQIIVPHMPMFIYNGTQRPPSAAPTAYMSSTYPALLSNAQMAYHPTFQPAQSQQYYYNPNVGLQRPPQPTPQPPVQQNMQHPPPQPMPMTQPAQQNTIGKTKTKRRNALQIINPETGKEVVIEDNDSSSHPPSGESSARQTPQPAAHNPSKEVQATFAKQVAQRLNDEEQEAAAVVASSPAPQLQQQPPVEQLHQVAAAVGGVHHPETHSTYHNPQSVHTSINRNDLVQCSKLQVPTKVFVPQNQTTTAKETPVVSANANAVEVTIKPPPPKDRESPVKSNRKHKEQQQQSIKEQQQPHVPAPVIISPPATSPKEVEKGTRDERQKEIVPPASSNQQPSKDAKEREQHPPQQQQQQLPVKEEKKPVKKEKLVEAKAGREDDVVVQPAQVAAQDNAKSKHNSQKAKQSSGNAPGGAAKQPQMPVPQSQPAKANNKTSKMKELNMKGATKEGTDMDAFNDSIAEPSPQPQPQPPVAEPEPVAETPPADPMPPPAKKEEVKAPAEVVVTAVPEVKPKSKIDITDIVREVPKPFIPPAPVLENKDETDRAIIGNDKMVQAKNEANTKASMEADENETKAKTLPYKDDQWSPYNKSGKKVYDRDFLMALKNVPKSKQKPENILNDIVIHDEKARLCDVGRYSSMGGGGGGRTDFAPSFNAQTFNKSSSVRGVVKRGSLGKGVGNTKGGKSGSNIRVSISFKEDVKLHETENAWKPARYNPGLTHTEEDKKTEELYRKVRGVLNKLTPQKFSTLVSQIKTLPIDTLHRLQGVIDLVFEKAVDEPNFSVAYALMCRELALMQVPLNVGSKEVVNFRKLLISRCQMEFEKNSNEELNRNERLREIEECTDQERKKELLIVMDEEDRRIRMKSVGNIRFIGELFKQQMLTVNIMMRCLQNLIENKDEERLECLCKLLTTIGKELEGRKMDLNPIFNAMKDIVDKKSNCRVSSRVRFMLQDVIDLRSGQWVPRRQDMNPKTIEQIQKEADNEQLNSQNFNSGSMTPRKDDRGMGSNDRKRGGGGKNTTDDGWSTQTSRGKNSNQQFLVQSDKLKIKHTPKEDEPLGSSQLFGSWVRGSNIQKNPQPTPNTANMYAALEKITDSDSRSMGRGPGRDTYNSKGSSMERSAYKQFDGRGSRSGSQHRSNEGSQRSTPTPASMQPPMRPPPERQQPAPAPPAPEQTKVRLTPEQLERRIKNIIEEYVNDCCSLDEANSDVQVSIPQSAMEQFVHDGYNNILERSKTARIRTGMLFAQLINLGTLTLDSYCAALEKLFEYAEDMIIDIPGLWNYYAELIVSPMTEKAISLKRLHKCCKVLISQNFAHNLLASLFKLVIEERGPNFLVSIWKSSDLSLQEFMPNDKVDSFITNNHFELLTGSGSETTIINSNLSYTQIADRLSNFLETNTTFDDITKWVTANLGDRMKEKQFIRTLATVLINSSIHSDKLNLQTLNSYYPFFQRYIDNNPEYELQCLYAIQSIVNKLSHPQGLLLSLFNTLYEDNLISFESFITWEKSNDPDGQENKGVAVKQLTSFFTQLKENDEDTGTSGSEEA